MTTRFRWLALAGFTALLAAGAAACGETTTTTTHNLCFNVACEEGLTCDPADGHCKCGGPGGPTCKPGEVCNADSGVCFSPKCEFQPCDKGQTCDPLDGVCKCGDTVCQDGEACVDLTCVTGDLCKGKPCGTGEACDPTDGLCKCSGVACDVGQSCIEGGCMDDPCAGVNCTRNAVCSRTDGRCHCMGSTGPICTLGEACLADSMVCEGTSRCDGVTCGGGTACDPADGKCHCDGTFASGSPICEPGQTCINGECIGGLLCKDVQCPEDYQCDPKFGICRCGDSEAGPICDDGEACTYMLEKWTCAQPCTLLGSPTGCESGFSCVLDVSLKSGQAFCAPSGSKNNDQECVFAYDCREGLVCMHGIDTKACKTLCSRDGDECSGLGSGYRCFFGLEELPDDIGVCTKVI